MNANTIGTGPRFDPGATAAGMAAAIAAAIHVAHITSAYAATVSAMRRHCRALEFMRQHDERGGRWS